MIVAYETACWLGGHNTALEKVWGVQETPNTIKNMLSELPGTYTIYSRNELSEKVAPRTFLRSTRRASFLYLLLLSLLAVEGDVKLHLLL